MSLRGMIASVGGSPDAVLKALGGEYPRVLFVVSASSKSQVDLQIIPELRDRSPHYQPQYEYLQVPHENIEKCYEKIRDGIERWRFNHGLAPESM